MKSPDRLARPLAMMTHRPVMGSLRNSGNRRDSSELNDAVEQLTIIANTWRRPSLYVVCPFGPKVPRNFMKNGQSCGRLEEAGACEVGRAVAKLRPVVCLIRSVLVERINGRQCSRRERR